MWERDFVERAVTEIVDAVRVGTGGTLFIVGEPGLGKTTSLRFARAHAEPHLRLGVGYGDAMEASVPFALLADALRSVGAPDVSELVDLHDSAVNTRAGRFYRVSRWLRESVSEPLLLMLDDVHWADADSLALLSFLCRRIDSSPVAVIATLRSWPQDAQHLVADLVHAECAKEVRLRPLSRNAARAVLEANIGHAVSERLALDAYQLSAGNPLLLEQLAHLVSRDALANLTPSAAEGLLLTRFAGLSVAGMRCAQAASVLGVRFRLDVAAAMAQVPDSEIPEIVESLYRSGLVVDGPRGWSRFAHPLFAQALYADLAPPLRAILHRRAFHTLVDRGWEIESAEHAVRGELAGCAAAVRILGEVGRSAMRSGGLATAVRYLTAAVDLAGDHVTAVLLLGLGDALVAAGRPAEAITVYERVLARDDVDLATTVRTQRMLARAHFAVGSHDAARTSCERAVALAGDSLPDAAAGLLLDAAVATRLTTGVRHSLSLVHQARALRERLDARTRELVDLVATWMELHAGVTVDPTMRAPRGDDPAELVDEAWSWGLVDARVNIALVTERYADARRVLDSALAAAERAGAVEAVGALSVRAAVLVGRIGPLDEALEHASRAVDVVELVPVVESSARIAGALILLYMGRIAECLRWCDMAETRATERGEGLVLVWCWHVRAMLASRAGHLTEACERYERLERLTERMGIGEPCMGLWARHAIAAHLADRDVDAAVRTVATLEGYSGRSATRWPRIAAATGRAWLAEHDGDQDGALKWFQTALALHHEVDLPLEHAETLIAYGAFLRRRGRRTEARTPLAEALDVAQHQHAGLLAEQARHELSIVRGRRRRSFSASPQLTEQESRVAALASEGRSNKEIAGVLCVSVKTVDYHLQQIYRKLGLHSRRQLMTLVRDDPGVVRSGTGDRHDSD
jgi:DNA-binding CsgD family transcriptional regulator